MRMDKLLMMLALGACCLSGAAETVAYWRFGDQGLKDCSGNNVELVNTNVELDSTGAAVFNGTDAFLVTKESLDLTAYNKLTVECWIKPEPPEAASTDFMPLFQHYFWDSTIRNYPGSFVTYFSGNDNGFKTFRSQLRDGAGGGDWTISVLEGSAENYPIMDGTWHHVALVMDLTASGADKAKLYVDGGLVPCTTPIETAAINSFANYKFVLGGGGAYVPGKDFHGAIDDVRISTDALEPSQFLKFPTAGRHQSPENPAVAYWPFGSKGLADVSGNAETLQVCGAGGVSYGNGCVSLPGTANLMHGSAFRVDNFSNSGLTYELFFRSARTKGSGLSILLENSGDFNQRPGTMIWYYEHGTGINSPGLRTQYGYNTKNSDPTGPDASPDDGQWHHLALVYDPKQSDVNRVRAYLDGRALPTNPDFSATDIVPLNGACSLFIGGRANASDTFFVGEIDDVRVMPWALTPAEFLQERSVETIAHWKFNNPETALTDLSGNGYALENNGVVFENGSAVFNGSGASLCTTKPLELSGRKQLTIEGLFWLDESWAFGPLFGTTGGPDDGEHDQTFLTYVYEGNVMSELWFANNTYAQYTWPGVSLSLGSWHHVAYVIDLNYATAERTCLWVDGVKQSFNHDDLTSLSALWDDRLAIGNGVWKYKGSFATSFKGRIAEMVVSPEALTATSFRLLNTPKPGEVIVRPSAVPTESAALDLTGKTDLTVECFAKFPAEGAAGELFAFAPEGAPQFQLAVADGVLKAKVVPGTGGLNVETAVVPTDGAWHHVAMVVDGYAAGASRVRLYVDGVRSATHAERVNWSVPFAAGTFEVGSGFNGKVSSVRVTTGVVAPADFLTERLKAGLTVLLR